MKVVSIVGPSDSGKTTLVARLVERLRRRGRVGTVKHLTHGPDIDTEGTDTARHRAAGAATTVGVTDEDGWFATGTATTLEDVLDELATDHDYAAVEGYTGAALPTVTLGGSDAGPGPTVARASTADDVDVPALAADVDALDDRVTLDSLVRAVTTTRGDGTGTVASASVHVRPEERAGDADGDRPGPAEEARLSDRLETLGRALATRVGVEAVRVQHRPCVQEADATDVFVVVLARHHREAMAAMADGIDRLDTAVPLGERTVTVEDVPSARDP